MSSLNCYSQKDTTKVVLPTKIARLVYQDLIRYDGCLEENELLRNKTIKLDELISTKDTIISLLEEKDKNNEFIINKKNEQLTLSKELTDKLHKELKSERRKGFLWKAGTFLFLTTSTLLIVSK